MLSEICNQLIGSNTSICQTTEEIEPLITISAVAVTTGLIFSRIVPLLFQSRERTATDSHIQQVEILDSSLPTLLPGSTPPGSTPPENTSDNSVFPNEEQPSHLETPTVTVINASPNTTPPLSSELNQNEFFKKLADKHMLLRICRYLDPDSANQLMSTSKTAYQWILWQDQAVQMRLDEVSWHLVPHWPSFCRGKGVNLLTLLITTLKLTETNTFIRNKLNECRSLRFDQPDDVVKQSMTFFKDLVKLSNDTKVYYSLGAYLNNRLRFISLRIVKNSFQNTKNVIFQQMEFPFGNIELYQPESDVPHQRIVSLTGFPCLTSLLKLDLSFQNISSIDGLQNMDTLKELTLEGNQISQIEVSLLNCLSNLEFLDLSHNQICSLALFPQLIKLRVLELSHNKIKTVKGLPTLPNLQYLYLNGNQITSYEGMPQFPRRVEIDLFDQKTG